jgi:thioredoxin reductase (NADPH)
MLTATTRSTPLTSAANAALVFPVLSTAQISRIASHRLIRPITRGEVLIEAGQTNVPFFVVKAGEIEVIRPSGLGDPLLAIVRANQFTGDVMAALDMLSTF